MDATARSAAVLAAAALLVVPLVNALVLESRQTADRQVTDPPEDLPPPPEDPPPGQENASRELPEGAARSAGGNCTPVPEDRPAARWHHPTPEDRPGAAAQTRLQRPEERSFQVSDLHPVARVQLNVSDLTGTLQASVHPDGQADEAPFEVQLQRTVPGDVAEGTTLTRGGALASGDWTARLEADGASYRELTFTVVRGICQEAAP